MARKKQKWQVGDYFGVPTENGNFAIGQIMGDYHYMAMGLACIMSSKTIDLNSEHINFEEKDIISAIFVIDGALTRGEWPILAHGIADKKLLKKYLPQTDSIEKGDAIGFSVYTSGILDEFVKAYFGLIPWNDWHDPEFLDKEILISPDKKPDNVVYK